MDHTAPVMVHRAASGATRIVCLGGGTGVPNVLRGLSRYARASEDEPGADITAIVAMSDDGGSSGRLRREREAAPPGDVRNCLLALSGERGPLRELFRHRFGGSKGLGGHALGNLLLTALAERQGSFLSAVRSAERLLEARGRVLPSTLVPVHLVARLSDARMMAGERNLARAHAPVRAVSLAPRAPRACEGVLESLAAADLIALGPGSLYSSLLPCLLVDGVAEALARSRAPKVLVANLMTEPGETDGMSCAEHVRAIFSHVGRDAGPVLDAVLVNGRPLPGPALARYAGRGAVPSEVDRQALMAAGVIPLEADLLAEGPHLRHDGRKVARCLLRLARTGLPEGRDDANGE